LRIHRSYLVNVERVSKLEPYTKDSHIVILNDGTRLSISRTGYGRLRALLDQQNLTGRSHIPYEISSDECRLRYSITFRILRERR
jgi:LytTr DNA-binding domain